jgi:signal transduction histidine kinase
MASFVDVRKRIILLFALGIALPSALLGYLALRGIRNDQALLEREQRNELSRFAEVALAAYDSCVGAAGRSLDSTIALGESDPDNPSSPSLTESTGLARLEALDTLAVRHPLIEAVFHLSSDGLVDRFVAPRLLFRASTGPGQEDATFSSTPRMEQLEAARRMEFGGDDLAAALAAYQRIASGPYDSRARAEALVAVARIRRGQGGFEAASSIYWQLASEFGQVPTAGGLPFGLAAALELGRTQAQAGDTFGAAQTLVSLYDRLLESEAGLSRAQFGSFATSLRESLEGLLQGSPGDSRMEGLRLAAEGLAQEEERARSYTERLLAFQASATNDLVHRRNHEPGQPEDEHLRSSVDLGGYSFYALLRDPDSGGPAEATGTWGLLLDPDALASSLVDLLLDRSAPLGVGWTLRGAAGEVLASSDQVGGPPVEGLEAAGGEGEASASPDDRVVVVRSLLPGAFPPFTVELFQPDGGFLRTLLTSRRGVFLYGFLLLAGILVFGLILTVVTISHQLALARMQSDFVSTVSHEFKSPLTAIRQIAEMLHSGKAPSEERRQRYYDILLQQSERLSALIDRVLDFARIDSGQQTFRFQPVAVGEFLQDAVSQAQQRFGPEGYDVQSQIPPDLPTVPLDADALGQAVANLIDNAVKYSGGSRKVIVRAFTEDGDVAMGVQDFGIGLDPKEKARVFERFYRGGDELTRSVKGTGLGLTLVKQIVEGHGGRVTVESEPGHGATFTLRVPLERPEP